MSDETRVSRIVKRLQESQAEMQRLSPAEPDRVGNPCGRTLWICFFGAALCVIVVVAGFTVFDCLKAVALATARAQPVSTPVDTESQWPQAHLITEAEAEAAMGGEAEPDDPQAREVVKVGNNLVANSAAANSPYPFHFHLVRDTKVASAYAFPDGQIVIARGLLERLGNESELAYVLGHECGHVVGGRMSIYSALMQLDVSITLTAATTSDEHAIRAERLAVLRAKRKELEAEVREIETEADLQALQFMSEAGYDPGGAEGALQLLAQTPIPAGSPLPWTHPSAKQRLEDVNRWIKKQFPNGVPSNLAKGLRLDLGIPADGIGPNHSSDAPSN